MSSTDQLKKKDDHEVLPTRHKSKAVWPSRVYFLVGMTIIAVLEHYAFLAAGLKHFEISIMAQFFQPLVRDATFPKIRPVATTILRIDAPEFQFRVGAGRQVLSDLLPKVQALGPHVIVLDTVFQELRRDAGENYDAVTVELLRSIHAVCNHIWVISGFDIQDWGIAPHVSTYTNTVSYCDEGFTNAENEERDFRRAPLRLEVDGQKYPSLSYAAARAFRTTIRKDEIIQNAWRTGEPLFVPLFEASDYMDRSISATTILSGLLSQEQRDLIKGSVLVVGFERGPSFKTPAGQLPAHMLHAAYIEAFLAGMLLREAPLKLESLLTLAFIVFSAWPLSPLRQAGNMLIGVCGLFVVEIVLVHFYGIYSDIAVVSTLGVALWPLNLLHNYFHSYRGH